MLNMETTEVMLVFLGTTLCGLIFLYAYTNFHSGAVSFWTRRSKRQKN
jgi:hypothetical protein